ncbi:MAG: tol-pal system protein YbgF [Pseudomonadota bacterium]
MTTVTKRMMTLTTEAPAAARPKLSAIGWLLMVLVLPLTALAPPVGAQTGEFSAMVQKLERLERDLQALQRQVYSGTPPQNATGRVPTGDAAYDTLSLRLDAFEQQMQALTGQIETTSFELRQLKGEMQSLAQDVDFRLRALEGKEPLAADPAGAPTGLTGAPSIADPAPAPQAAALPSGLNQPKNIAQPGGSIETFSGPPQERYDNALTFLQQGDHAKAERALSQFVTDHPDSELSGNAFYWLAETYYVRGQYKEAAQTFLDGLKAHPKSSKAPDSLLKLGMSLSSLGQKDQACRTLGEVPRRYPSATQTILQRAKIEAGKAGCR